MCSTSAAGRSAGKGENGDKEDQGKAENDDSEDKQEDDKADDKEEEEDGLHPSFPALASLRSASICHTGDDEDPDGEKTRTQHLGS